MKVNGITFDSEAEYERWLFLLELQKQGKISWLRRQVTYKLHAIGGMKITTYRADHVYVVNGKLIVEDVKSKFTAKMRSFQMRKKWMLSEHGIDVFVFIKKGKKK